MGGVLRGRDALTEGQEAPLEGLLTPPDQKALPQDCEGLGDRPEGPGGVGRPSSRAGRGRRSYWRAGGPSGGSEDQEALWEGGRLIQSTRSGWETLPEDREGSEGPPEDQGGVRRPSCRTKWGRKALPDGGRLFRRSAMGREAFPVCGE